MATARPQEIPTARARREKPFSLAISMDAPSARPVIASAMAMLRTGQISIKMYPTTKLPRVEPMMLHGEWSAWPVDAVLSVVSSFSGDNEFFSHELLNLMARTNISYGDRKSTRLNSSHLGISY